MVFSLQGERVFHVNLCVLVCDCACSLFPHPTGFRNKVLFPTITLKDIGAWQGPDRKHLTIIEILTQKKVLLIKYLTTIDK